ncbi:MAG: hypothetical protein LBG04_02325 [Holosporaceae bacterium]|nr:hypothetical protein [Holosporaceae bacterium]
MKKIKKVENKADVFPINAEFVCLGGSLKMVTLKKKKIMRTFLARLVNIYK